MRRFALVIVIVAAVVAFMRAQDAPRRPAPDLGGKLYKSVFAPGPGTLSSGDLAAVPDPLRSRLSRYLERRAAFKSRLEKKADSFENAASEAKKREMERAIVSLIEAPGIEATAVEFLRDAPIAHRWEGAHVGPAAEAVYAEEFLKKNPTSPLAPYVYLFIADRQRAAFEMYDHEKNAQGLTAAAKKYRAFVQRARAAQDVVFGLIADDLDRQPYLYTRTDKHPRDYDPDA